MPVIYQIAEDNSIEIFNNDNTVNRLDGLIIDVNTSEKIFKRTGEITLLKVSIQESILK